jgi:hypothetical protein
MKLETGTKAHKAYMQGRLAAKEGRTVKDANSYVTAKMVGLSNWFMKGYNEVLAEKS